MPREKAASAIALLFTGLTVVLGALALTCCSGRLDDREGLPARAATPVAAPAH